MATFKKPNRSFRKRKESDSSGEDEKEQSSCVGSVLEETKELQRLRKRQRGVNIEDLAAGQVVKKEQKGNADPLKLKTGGYVDIKTLKKEIANVEDIEQIGTSFAAETNRRDEDADMLKYVEEELKKRKGQGQDENDEEASRMVNPTDVLYELPEHLKNITSSHKRSEDMLSNQMLSGIPEIDLGIEAKITNIEKTEDAKQKLIDDRQKKKDAGVSNFVPTNMAVNFVQHNRFNIEDHKPSLRKEPPAPKPAPLRVGDVDRPSTLDDQKPRKSAGEKATDDFYYEKFKKQTRKY